MHAVRISILLAPAAFLYNRLYQDCFNKSNMQKETDFIIRRREKLTEDQASLGADITSLHYRALISLFPDVYTLAARLTGDACSARRITKQAYLRAATIIESSPADTDLPMLMQRQTVSCASLELGIRKSGENEDLPANSNLTERASTFSKDDDAQLELDENPLSEHLAALPPPMRAVVVLRDVYEIPTEMIAEDLGILKEESEEHLRNGRRMLKESITESTGAPPKTRVFPDQE
jgi:RNA polymerase sigma-70 factor, ECF subfamily